MDTKLYLYKTISKLKCCRFTSLSADKAMDNDLGVTYLIKASVAETCSVINQTHCFYTITCDNPVIINTINTISVCEHTDPYITVIINKFTANTITANFFTSKFDAWVRIFSAVENHFTSIQSFAFNNLKNVLYIDLSENHIQYLGPAFMGLETLDSLNLSGNLIQVINPGTFVISKRNKLYLLDLSNNLLTYLSEDMFVSLYNLRRLYLQGNKMATLSDELFRYLKNLNYLNFCCSNLRIWNVKIKHLTYLRELHLSHNNITFLNVSGLISLEMINLSHNGFEKFIFYDLRQSNYLSLVDLSYNKIKKISCPKSLQYINKNNEEEIDKQSVSIDFNNNNINYIDSNFFRTFNHIKYLNLSYNNITKFKPGTFKHVKVLEYLNVSNCKLQLDEETFKGLESTKLIDISSNNIIQLDAKFFDECLALKRIVANNNLIEAVNMDMFVKLVPTLTRITLKGNHNFGSSSKLQVDHVINITVGLIMELTKAILILLLLFLILLLLLYISIHRRVIFINILKCGRCASFRNKFRK